MILETMRILADWLGDATFGVNAHLATLTLDGTDTVPADVVTIADESTDGLLALGRITQATTDLPAIGIVQIGSFSLSSGNVSTSFQDADGRLAVWYFAAPDIAAADGRQAGLYTLRAVRQSLRDLLGDGAGAAAARSRGGVQLIHLTDLALPPAFKPVEDVIVTAGLELTVKVRDTTV